MKKILVLNQGNTENYGDVAILNTIKFYFNNKECYVDFFPFWDEKIVFGNNYFKYPYMFQKILLKTLKRIDFFNKFSIKRFIDFKYDAVIIGGGELLGNHVGFNSSLYVWSQLLKSKNIPFYVLGVSGNKLINDDMMKRNAKALSQAEYVLVRDNLTKKIYSDKYGINCIYSPDVVFAYNKIRKIGNNDIHRSGIVVAPISYCYEIKINLGIENEEQYINYLKKIVEENRNGNEEIIVSCTAKEDSFISKKLFDSLGDNTNVSYARYENLESYEKLVRNSRIIISARMHALILGVINGCTIETIPFKEKLTEFKKHHEDKNIQIDELNDKVMKGFQMIEKDISRRHE